MNSSFKFDTTELFGRVGFGFKICRVRSDSGSHFLGSGRARVKLLHVGSGRVRVQKVEPVQDSMPDS